MGVMDSMQRLNPFKKEDDFPPLPEPTLPDMQAPAHQDPLAPPMQLGSPPPVNPPSQPFGAPSFQQHEAAQDDSRMQMPLGRTLSREPDKEEYQKETYKENPLQKDLELISSKIDYLKASLEAINQRLSNLEHMARIEQESKRW